MKSDESVVTPEQAFDWTYWLLIAGIVAAGLAVIGLPAYFGAY